MPITLGSNSQLGSATLGPGGAGTLLTDAKSQIAANGQLLTVRRNTSQGMPESTRLVGFIPKMAPHRVQSLHLLAEGGINAANDDAQTFDCAGDADVLENDAIEYDGYLFRVMRRSGDFIAAVRPWLHCASKRERKLP